ncbi:hypothetical protein [Dyella sp.]|uniref:hypothetical protein n=1 Tax=Dyella sp. TaxID=1869338 RepID=UPI002D77CE40|nr:hypothetical protein [Dyella sp.]HET7331946.1 hypothetical protein [Dyella sp.]
MLSNRRTRCLLLACCAFLALLLMGVSAASDTHVRVAHHGAAHASAAFVVDGVCLTDKQGSWHVAAPELPSDPIIEAYSGGVDDELVMPLALDLELDHPRFDTPAGVIPPLLIAPAARLLRPPRLA